MLIYFLTVYIAIKQSDALSLFGFSLYGGGICGVMLWVRVAPLLDKHVLCTVALVLTGAVTLVGFWIGGATPAFAEMRMPILMIGSAAVGALGSGLWVLAPSMLADLAEEHELRTNERSEGAFMGVFSASVQTAAGLGTAMIGILLDQFAHVVPGSATQTPATVARIGILASIVPGVLTIAAGVVMLSYNLTRRRVSLVQATLTARRLSSV